MRDYRIDCISQEILNRGLLRPLDVLLVGGTGAGKSSTLNSIFGAAVAKVGEGVDPETKKFLLILLIIILDFMILQDWGTGVLLM